MTVAVNNNVKKKTEKKIPKVGAIKVDAILCCVLFFYLGGNLGVKPRTVNSPIRNGNLFQIKR